MKHLHFTIAVILTSTAMAIILRPVAVVPAPSSLTFDDDSNSNTGVFMLTDDEVGFACRGELVDVAYAPGIRECWDRYVNQQQCGC